MIRGNWRPKFLLLIGVLPACRPAAPDGVALVGATVIDGSGGKPLSDAVVVVRRGKIETIGSRLGFQLPKRTSEVDVKGRWIIPGLIDAHAHITPAINWAPSRFLAWGVTTIRDVHGPLETVLTLRKQANSEGGSVPRMYASGAMIDGLPPTFPDAIGVSREKDARRAVDHLVSAGIDFVKVYTHIDGPLLRAILDEARTFNLRVTGHLGMVDAVTAARAGITAIEHLTGVPEAVLPDRSSLISAHYRGFFPGWTAFERSWANLDPAALEQVAATLARQKVILIPTLTLHETLSRLNDPPALRERGLEEVPSSARQEWSVPDVIRRAGWTDTDFAAFRRSRPVQDRFIRQFVAAGGRIAVGSDAANQLMAPGSSTHHEMELLVRAGLSARDALRAATRNGAALLGVDSLGLLAPGKAADLVVLANNPLADIRNTRSVAAVMLRGRLFDPDSIRASW